MTAVLERVKPLGTERLVPEGQTLCTEGEVADRWWMVVDGLADVTISGLYAATIGPGETIGEIALLDGEPRAATVTAVTDMRLREVDAGAFMDEIRSDPDFAVALLRELAGRLRATNLRAAGARPAAVAPPAPVPRPASARPAPGGRAVGTSGRTPPLDGPPLEWSEELSSWIVRRYEDVHRLSRSRAVTGSVATLGVRNPDARRQPGWRMMILRDGDDHTRLRRLVSKAFSPRAIAEWGERASSIVGRLLDAAGDRDDLDVIADYALPLPAQVITEMLGLPAGDTAQLRTWSRALTYRLDPLLTPEQEDEANAAGQRMGEYVEAAIADKRSHPGDDILTALIDAEDNGDVLDDRELLNQVVMIYIAGHETTLNLIGNGVHNLLREPQQLDLLRTTPDLDANAVEEILRFEGPAQLTRRVTVEPVEVAGQTLPARSHVTLSLVAANHDPTKWGPTADVLDIARPGANDHVSFGGGAHYCLGASLARLEARIALPRLLRRFPRMAPTSDHPVWVERTGLRGLQSLPVTLR